MEFAQFRDKLASEFGINLWGYKEKQLRRRIDSLMASIGVQGYIEYFRLLKKEESEWQRFLDRVTINVSEFFRNPDIFRQLEENILPDLLTGSKLLKVWSAACSNGSEPYSVAMILEELTPGVKHSQLATDIDVKILETAKSGLFDANTVRNVSSHRLRRYFVPSEGKYQLENGIIDRIQFRKHDLLVDTFGRGYDLIICRNVTIYFTPEAQDSLYRKFHAALNPGGVLFVGATESILRYHDLGFDKISPWFYGKAQ